MVTKEFNNLEGWVKDKAQKHIDELTKILSTDLSKTEVRWACEEQIEIISSLKEAWQKKLDYIKTVLSTMETEVLGAPMADSEKKTRVNTDHLLSELWMELLGKQNKVH